MKSFVCVLIFVVCAQSVKLPANFKKCNRNDANADKCYLEAAQNGIEQLTKAFPEINVPSIAPLHITQLKIGAGSQAVVNVEQNFKNCELHGLNFAKLSRFSFNFAEKYLDAAGFVAEVKKICDYQLNGKVLLLPIVGEGKSTVLIKNAQISGRFNFDIVEKNKKHYIKFTTTKLSLEPESMNFNFENLFNGDKQLGDNVNKVLNDNNKEVFADVRAGYEEGLGAIIQHTLQGFFNKVSVEEAFD